MLSIVGLCFIEISAKHTTRSNFESAELHACHFALAQLQFLTHTLVARLSCAVVSFLDEENN